MRMALSMFHSEIFLPRDCSLAEVFLNPLHMSVGHSLLTGSALQILKIGIEVLCQNCRAVGMSEDDSGAI